MNLKNKKKNVLVTGIRQRKYIKLICIYLGHLYKNVLNSEINSVSMASTVVLALAQGGVSSTSEACASNTSHLPAASSTGVTLGGTSTFVPGSKTCSLSWCHFPLQLPLVSSVSAKREKRERTLKCLCVKKWLKFIKVKRTITDESFFFFAAYRLSCHALTGCGG